MPQPAPPPPRPLLPCRLPCGGDGTAHPVHAIRITPSPPDRALTVGRGTDSTATTTPLRKPVETVHALTELSWTALWRAAARRPHRSPPPAATSATTAPSCTASPSRTASPSHTAPPFDNAPPLAPPTDRTQRGSFPACTGRSSTARPRARTGPTSLGPRHGRRRARCRVDLSRPVRRSPWNGTARTGR